MSEAVKLPVVEWKCVLTNAFEKHIFELYPQLAELKAELYRSGAVYASMSGSGSAIYGIFDSDNMAESFVPRCQQHAVYKLRL